MSSPDQLEDLLRESLGSVAVAAPVDRGLEGVHRIRHRRRVRRAVAAGAIVVVVLVVAGLTLHDRGDSSRRLDVVDIPPPTTEVQVPLDHVTPVVDTPAVEDPAITLTPAGPYTDGQTVGVGVPSGFGADWPNDPPALCMTIDDFGGELCDPTAAPAKYPTLTSAPAGDTATMGLARRVFTPTGWRDCNDPGLTCRLVVRARDGSYRASVPLVFTGPTTPPTTTITVDPSPVTEGETVMVTAHGLAPHPSWLQRLASHPTLAADYPAFTVTVCAAMARTTNCSFLTSNDPIATDQPDTTFTVRAGREVFGYGGWDDCAAVPCYLVLHRNKVMGDAGGGGILGSDEVVAVTPLRFDDRVAPRPRPALAVVEVGPYRAGQQVSVRATNLPTESWAGSVSLALCHQDPTKNNDCNYLARPAVADGGFVATVVLPAGAGIGGEVPCTGSPCFLALMPGGEGLGPLASQPIQLSP